MIKQPKVQSAVIGLLAALCLVGIGVEASGAGKPPATTATSAVKLTGAALVSYTNCSQMLEQVKTQALKEVGPYGLAATTDGVPYGGVWPRRRLRPGTCRCQTGRPLAAGALAAELPCRPRRWPVRPVHPAIPRVRAQDYSTTNDQEAGVDEPDMVKTNGQLMVILRQQPQGLQVVDVRGSTPVLDGFLALPQLADLDGMFLVGQDAVVIGGVVSPSQPVSYTYTGGAVPLPSPPAGRVNPGGPMIPAPTIAWPNMVPFGGGASSTDVVVVSLADPQAPGIVSTFSFQGQIRARASSMARLSWRLRTSRACPGSMPVTRRRQRRRLQPSPTGLSSSPPKLPTGSLLPA